MENNTDLPLEIQTTSTWYQYPEYKPEDNDDDENMPYEEYEVFWRWDKASFKNNQFLSYALWMDGIWQEHDGGHWFEDFENPLYQKAEKMKRIVMYWRKAEHPIKYD